MWASSSLDFFQLLSFFLFLSFCILLSLSTIFSLLQVMWREAAKQSNHFYLFNSDSARASQLRFRKANITPTRKLGSPLNDFQFQVLFRRCALARIKNDFSFPFSSLIRSMDWSCVLCVCGAWSVERGAYGTTKYVDEHCKVCIMISSEEMERKNGLLGSSSREKNGSH